MIIFQIILGTPAPDTVSVASTVDSTKKLTVEESCEDMMKKIISYLKGELTGIIIIFSFRDCDFLAI